eukprot:IDg11617t1
MTQSLKHLIDPSARTANAFRAVCDCAIAACSVSEACAYARGDVFAGVMRSAASDIAVAMSAKGFALSTVARWKLSEAMGM